MYYRFFAQFAQIFSVRKDNIEKINDKQLPIFKPSNSNK